MTALFIHAEEKGPAWQVWPKPDAIPAGAIRENTAYVFELHDCADPAAADLFIDDVPLEALRARQQVARWRWSPGFHAGSVEAILRMPGSGPRHFEITTDPDLRKLTRADFDTMVRELLEDTTALFSLSAFRRGIGRQAGKRPPPLARLEFLRSRATEIVDAIEAIARAPRHFLRPEEITLPAHRATRATGPEILKSFRSGEVRAETGRPSRLPATLKGRLPAKITMRTRRNSVDIAEHRQIKACLVSWAAWLNNVAATLDGIRPAGDAGTGGTAAAWALRTLRVARRFAAAADTPFMREVGPGTPELRMSSLFRRDPAYLRFHRLWQDMNLGLAALFGDFLDMPLARTYELYELWCFLRLLRAAVDEYGPQGIDLGQLFTTDAAGGVTLAANAVVVPLGGGRALCFQRQYREYWVEPDGKGSFSRTMVPDIAFAGPAGGVQDARLIVMDAKYRIAENLNDALNSIHTYRDALVREAQSGKTEGVVTAAYLLTPHIPELRADFQNTPLPGRLFHPQYRTKFRFGAVTLRPGMTSAELRAALQTIVADVATAGGTP